MKSLIYFFLFIVSIPLFSQQAGLQDTGLRNAFTALGADFSQTNIRNYDSELQQIFLDMDTGPYYKDSWFQIVINGISSSQEIDDSVKFRFDMYNHDLQYLTPSMEVPVELTFKLIKGFTLIDRIGRAEKFIKYLNADNFTQGQQNKFYKILVDGDHKLLKLFYSELDISQPYGPGNDGRVKKKFLDKSALYYMSPNNQLTLLRVKSKYLADVFPDKITDIEKFEKENGRIKKEIQLVRFFNEHFNSLN